MVTVMVFCCQESRLKRVSKSGIFFAGYRALPVSFCGRLFNPPIGGVKETHKDTVTVTADLGHKML